MSSKTKSGDTTNQVLSALNDLRGHVETLTETVNGQGKKWNKGLTAIVDRLDKLTTGDQTGGTTKKMTKKKEVDPDKPKAPLTARLRFGNDYRSEMKEKFKDIEDNKERQEKIREALSKKWDTDKKIKDKYTKEQEKLTKDYQEKMKKYRESKKNEVERSETEKEEESEEEEKPTKTITKKATPEKAGKRKKSPPKTENIFDDSDEELQKELEEDD